MADSQPSTGPQPVTESGPPAKIPARRNPALRMLGLPMLPRKLPSRNWMIFWTLSTAISAAIIYDKREKKRATARWAHAVEHLATVPLRDPRAMPRKLTVMLSSPPGDGLRTAQDHFTEYVKPVLVASGLDWDFVQGRKEGDVRAAVAERLRRIRRDWDQDLNGTAAEDKVPTDDEVVQAIRIQNKTPVYEGVGGDIVIGRHTWKEYVRGLHEGWLGPLQPPIEPEPEVDTNDDKEGKNEEQEAKPKPKVPPQPEPYNSPNDYPSSPLPLLIPAELAPTTPVREPHILGFSNTPTRMRRFFNRRALADDIGREVAAVCLAAYRDFREFPNADGSGDSFEQQNILDWEERDWTKSVWKEGGEEEGEQAGAKRENNKIWARPVVIDPRIATRMRRFELLPEDEVRARGIIVPEAEIEGWIKGNIRKLVRWTVSKVAGDGKKPIPVDEE